MSFMSERKRMATTRKIVIKSSNKKKIENILKIVDKNLSDINYALIGSVNLYIQKIKVVPNDLDILTTKKDIVEISNRLKKFQTKKMYFDKSNGRNSWRAFFKIDGIEIEVLGNINNSCRPKNSIKKRILVKHNKLNLFCMPLTEELKAYKKMKRNDKVELIKKFLDNTPNKKRVKRY